MECSIKGEKAQAMKNYKRAKFLYNLVLYSLTSLITCIFFSYYYSWFPSILPFLPNDLSVFLDAKCFFIVGNLIVFFLVGESKLKRSSHSCSSPSDTLYNEYIARSRSSYIVNSNETNNGGVVKNPSNETKNHGNREKISRRGEKKKEIIMRVCKSTNMPHDQEKKKLGMRSCKSEVWGESDQENKKLGMRSSKSEIWGESENIVKMEKTPIEKKGEIYVQGEELNKRVEAFIARVNKQRLLETKLVDHL